MPSPRRSVLIEERLSSRGDFDDTELTLISEVALGPCSPRRSAGIPTVGNHEAACRARDWVSSHFDEKGRLGEQFGGEQRDPEHYNEWVERWGPPAKDLTWSHAMYLVLCAALNARLREN